MKLSFVEDGQMTVFIRSLISNTYRNTKMLGDGDAINYLTITNVLMNGGEIEDDVNGCILEYASFYDEKNFVPINTIDLVFLNSDDLVNDIGLWVANLDEMLVKYCRAVNNVIVDDNLTIMIHSRGGINKKGSVMKRTIEDLMEDTVVVKRIVVADDPLFYFKHNGMVGVVYIPENIMTPEFILWDRTYLKDELAARNITLPDDIMIE